MLASITSTHRTDKERGSDRLRSMTIHMPRDLTALGLRKCQKTQFHNEAKTQRCPSAEGLSRPVPDILPLATMLAPCLSFITGCWFLAPSGRPRRAQALFLLHHLLALWPWPVPLVAPSHSCLTHTQGGKHIIARTEWHKCIWLSVRVSVNVNLSQFLLVVIKELCESLSLVSWARVCVCIICISFLFYWSLSKWLKDNHITTEWLLIISETFNQERPPPYPSPLVQAGFSTTSLSLLFFLSSSFGKGTLVLWPSFFPLHLLSLLSVSAHSLILPRLRAEWAVLIYDLFSVLPGSGATGEWEESMITFSPRRWIQEWPCSQNLLHASSGYST